MAGVLEDEFAVAAIFAADHPGRLHDAGTPGSFPKLLFPK